VELEQKGCTVSIQLERLFGGAREGEGVNLKESKS